MPGDRSPERSNYVPRGVDPRRRDDREPQRYDSRPSYEYDRGIGSSGRRPPTPPITSRPPTPPLHRRQASPPTGPRGGGRKRRIDSIDSRSGAEVESYFGQDRRSGDGRDGYPMTHRPNDVRSYSPRVGDRQRRKTPDSVDAELDALEKLIMSIHSAMTAMSQQTLASTHVKRLESFSSGAETNPLLDARDAFRDAEKTYLARMHELREVWVSVFRRRDGRGTGTAIGGGITVDALNERLASLERNIREKGRAVETPLITPTSAPPRPNFPSATITHIDDDAGPSKRQKTDDRLAEALVKVNSLEAMVLGFDERFNELENWAYLTEGEQQRNQPITSWEEIEAQRDPLGRLRGVVPAQARQAAVPRVAAIAPPAEDDGWGDFDNERDPDRALRGPIPAEPLSGLIDHPLLREMQASMAKMNETLISHSKLIDEQKGLISVHRNMQRIMGDDVKALKEDKEAIAKARAEEKAEFERRRKKDAEELETTLEGFLSMIKSECKEQARIQAAIVIDKARADLRAAAQRHIPAGTLAATPAAAAGTPGGTGPAAATDSTGPAAAVVAGAVAGVSTAPSAAPALAASAPSQSAQDAPSTAQTTAPPQSAGPRSTAQTQSVPVLPTSASIAPAAPTSTANHIVPSGEKPAPAQAPKASAGTAILGAAAAAAAAPRTSAPTAAPKAAIVKAPARAPALPSGPAAAPNVPPPPFALVSRPIPAPKTAFAPGTEPPSPPFKTLGPSPRSTFSEAMGPLPTSAGPPVLPTVPNFWPQLRKWEETSQSEPKAAETKPGGSASASTSSINNISAVDPARERIASSLPQSSRPVTPITTPAVQSEEVKVVSTLPRTLVPDKPPAPAVPAQSAPKPASAKAASTAGSSNTQTSAKLVLRAPGATSAAPNTSSSSSLPSKPPGPARPVQRSAGWSTGPSTDRNPTPAPAPVPASNLPPRLLPSASVSSRSPSPAPISSFKPPSRPPTPALPPHSTPPPPPPSNTPPPSAPPPPPSGTPPPSAPPTPASVAPAPVARAESESSMEMDIDEAEPVVAVPPASRLSVGAPQRTTSFEGRPRPPHQDIPPVAAPPAPTRQTSLNTMASSNPATSAAAAADVPPRPSSANGQRPPTGPAVSRRSPPRSGPSIKGYANNGTGSSGTADRASAPPRSQASAPLHGLPARPADLPPADVPPSVLARSAKELPAGRESAPAQPAIKINLDPLRFAVSPLNPPPTDKPRTASNPTSAPARVSPPPAKAVPPPAEKPASVPLHPGAVPLPDPRIPWAKEAYHPKNHLVYVCENIRKSMQAGATLDAAAKALGSGSARKTMAELSPSQRLDIATKPLSEWGWLDAWAIAAAKAKAEAASAALALASAQAQGKAGSVPPARTGSEGHGVTGLAARIGSGSVPAASSGGSTAISTSSSSSPSSSPAPHGAPSALGARIGQPSSKGPLAGRMSSGGGDGLTPTSSPSVSSPFVNLPPRPSPHVDASPWSSMLNAGLGPFGSETGPALAENAFTAAHREAALRAELTRKKQAKEAGGGHRRSESVDSDGDVRMGDASASAPAGSTGAGSGARSGGGGEEGKGNSNPLQSRMGWNPFNAWGGKK